MHGFCGLGIEFTNAATLDILHGRLFELYGFESDGNGRCGCKPVPE